MIYPKFLKENDLIDVPAPSDGADCIECICQVKIDPFYKSILTPLK